MPKRPTLRALEAEKELLRMLENPEKGNGAPLPPVRKLGETLGLSFATVSRLLQRFVEEGRAWRHPNGRIFPAQAGQKEAKGLPIVILGRQIQHWSRLYQEIIEGVSEICAALGCPLVLLSSDKLVGQNSPEMPPVFASRDTQQAELQRLVAAMPRLCGGVLLDHLWEEELIAPALTSSIPRVLLGRQPLHGDLLSVAPDFAAGARLLLEYLARLQCQRICLAVPFRGDQMVDAAGEILRQAVARGSYPFSKLETIDCSTAKKRASATNRFARSKIRTGVVCTEDNVASLLKEGFMEAGFHQTGTVALASMQGTGVMEAETSAARLRYDYRQLGRDAVAMVLERRRAGLLLPPQIAEPIALRADL